MATVELAGAPATADGVTGAGTGAARTAPPRAAGALILALLALLAYAAFAGGASSDPTEARLQVALALVAAVTGAGWLWDGGVRLAAPRLAWAGAGMLASFVVWTGVTVLWSVAPDQTWIELNRVLAYVVALVLAFAAGSSWERSVERFAVGFLLLVTAVTIYALGQKIAPGLHVTGLFDLNQASISPRLRAPLDYWNALALFIVFGIPLALAVVLDRDRPQRIRLAALLSITAMIVALGATYSRGGVVALVLAVAVTAWLAASWIRAGVAIAAAALAAVPALAFALSDGALTGLGRPLGGREAAGAVLGAILLVSLAGLWRGGRALIAREDRAVLPHWRVRGLRRLAVAVVAVVLVTGVVAATLSSRGLGGTASHLWHGFTTEKSASIYEPNRLLSTDSGNRWAWWKEAAGAFSDRPVAGWGAGSFAVLDLLYRRNPAISVRQPHELALQLLAETGAVGALLGLGALALLLAAGLRAVRSRALGAERALAAALLAGAVAYLAQALYDWDWDIPGVTLPALVFLGILAGAARSSRPAQLVPGWGSGSVLRLLGVGAVALVMCMFAVSAVLPSMSASRAQAALVAASGSSPGSLRSALATASLSSRLDPLSDAGLKAAATIEVHAGNLAAGRRYLLDAVNRAPDDIAAWQQLAQLEQLVGDRAGLQIAAARVLALDPRGFASLAVAAGAIQAAAPPNDSATATGTPLPMTPYTGRS